jgi:hypothetical protein
MRAEEARHLRRSLNLVTKYAFDNSILIKSIISGIPRYLLKAGLDLNGWEEIAILLSSPFYSLQRELEDGTMRVTISRASGRSDL